MNEKVKGKLRRLMEKRETRDLSKAAAETAEKEYRELEAEIWDDIEESDLEGTIKINLGEPYGTVSFGKKETFYGRVLDKDAALDYFENRALVEEFTEPKISKARINELIKEHIEQAKPMPPGLDYYAQRYISITRQKG